MRRFNRRVTVKPKPWGGALTTARLYVDGEPIARGYLDETGVVWTAAYRVVEMFDVTESGAVVSYGPNGADPDLF